MMRNKLSPLLLLIFVLPFLPFSQTRAQQVSLAIEGLIAYIGEDHNVWILHGASAESFPVTQDGTEDDRYLLPRFSPDGSMLAYCKLVDQDPDKAQLYVARVGDWQPMLLTDSMHCYDWPSLSYDWSPDNTRIIYTRPFASNDQQDAGSGQWASYGGIWMVEVNTGAVSEIIPPPGNNPLINPQWSPDGTWLKLYEYSFTGSRGNLLTGHNETGTLYTWFGGSSIWPGASDWSPDSSQIVFDEIAYTGFKGAGIYIASPKGENITKIYSSPNQMPRYPIWAPDNQTIAFQSTIPNHNPVMTLVKPDGSDAQSTHTGHKRILPLSWNPSGRQLLFGTYEEERLYLYIYDLDTETTSQLEPAGAWGADWSIGLVDSGTQLETVVHPGFSYSDSLILYVALDRKLVLHDPNDGSELELSEPYSITSFYPSPSGRRLIYGRHLVTLQFQDNDDLVIANTLLPSSPVSDAVSWSSDESQLAFQDWRGDVWIADLLGKAQQIPGAASVPEWSADGNWISYCTEDGALWVFGGGNQPVKIAENSTCGGQWSPSRNILAYTASDAPDDEIRDVALYDVDSLASQTVLRNAEVLSWSPDGKLLAIQSASTATADQTRDTIYVSTPGGDKILELGSLPGGESIPMGWVITDSDYLFNAYRIAPDLSSVTKVADSLLSSSDSGQLLVSNQELGFDVISCMDVVSGEQTRLLTVDRSAIPAEELPGMWGWMAPDGSQSITRTYFEGDYINLLHNCADATQVNLPFGDFPEIGSYSEGGHYFFIKKSGNGETGQLLVYDLELNQLERIPASTRHEAVWIGSAEKAGIHTVTGQVKQVDGTPLENASVFVDGILVTTTDENGAYTIIRLTPGDHAITIEKPDYNFSPRSYSITVPPDADRVDFRASTGAPPPEPEIPIEEQSPYAPPQDNGASTGIGAWWDIFIPRVISFFEWLASYVLTLLRQTILPGLYAIPAMMDSPANQVLLGVIVLGLGTIVVLGLLLRTRNRAKRKAAAAQPAAAEQPVKETTAVAETTETQPAPSVAPAQPATAQPSPEPEPTTRRASDAEILAWLKSGMEMVRVGDYDAGEGMFRRVAQERPDEPKAWLWLGYLAARKGDRRAAQRCFKLAKRFGHPNADKAIAWLEEQE